MAGWFNRHRFVAESRPRCSTGHGLTLGENSKRPEHAPEHFPTVRANRPRPPYNVKQLKDLHYTAASALCATSQQKDQEQNRNRNSRSQSKMYPVTARSFCAIKHPASSRSGRCFPGSGYCFNQCSGKRVARSWIRGEVIRCNLGRAQSRCYLANSSSQ